MEERFSKLIWKSRNRGKWGAQFGKRGPHFHKSKNMEIHDVRAWVSDEIQALKEEAEGLVARYYDQQISVGRTKQKEEASYLGVRCRMVKQTLSLEWFVQNVVRTNAGDRRVFSKHIPLGKGNKTHKKGALEKHARNWQLELVLEIEKRFGEIRALCEQYGKIRLIIYNLEKLVKATSSASE